MTPKHDRPIVIRRGGPVRQKPHGGSWKLAYADFMTAMMAFFLLMWLLGAVNPTQLSGIADYFRQPLKTAMLGGAKSSDGSTILPGGGSDLSRVDGERRLSHERLQIVPPQTPSPTTPASSKAAQDAPQDQARGQDRERDGKRDGERDRSEDARLRDLQAHIEDALSRNAALKPYRAQIMLDVTRFGLRIQIVDTQNRPMFATAKTSVEPYMRDILRQLGNSLNDVPNRIVLEGHTDAQTYAGGEAGYGNWELSSERANASRRELVAGGMSDGKVLRVMGLAATSPFNPADAFDPRNRRISIIVLNRRTEAQLGTDHVRAATVNDRGDGAQAVSDAALQGLAGGRD
ncbi:flagellar motor protein MotB [Robbsia sp. Bb-Pol-6]|uniref:Flagellar motor protein MotB n=1 Tax=Robbsia betulipollinis TaxID=2981849 RepID=A0ABT3ZHU9_9BURK|nr:flagellar motor protein MotB [Robbsia betulipollinis]MCY0386037.1 flagellar motor protein MotB [Robbsia betulipollinis]